MGKVRTVSVIIPTYNREKYIGAAIESILNQQPAGVKVEIFVMDDGSTDKTADIVKKYGKRIVYRRLKHAGLPSVPRNVGIKMSKGELIAFLDSDDVWVKDKLKLQLPAFEDPDVVLGYGNVSFMSEDGKVSKKPVVDPKHAKSGYAFQDLLKENFISTLTVVVRRSALNQHGLFDESPNLRAVEDYQLWLRLADKGKIKLVPQTLAHYRRHEANITNISDERVIYGQFLNVFKSLLKYSLSSVNKKATRRRLSQIYSIYSQKVNLSEKASSLVLSKWYRIRSL